MLPVRRTCPTTGRLDVMLRRLGAVVPPSGVPQALKQRLGIILGMAGDEVEIAAQGLVE